MAGPATLRHSPPLPATQLLHPYAPCFAPHSAQNFAAAATTAPHSVQWRCVGASTFCPHSAQNLAPAARAALHLAHCAAAVAGAAQAVGMKAEDVMATLEKLGDLKTKGILTQEEFDAKKAELLKKLV